MEQDEKQCPYCGEKILSIAKKCKYCKSWLNDDTENISINSYNSYQSNENIYTNIVGVIVLMIIIAVAFIIIFSNEDTKSNIVNFFSEESVINSVTKGCKKGKTVHYNIYNDHQTSTKYYCDNMDYMWDTVTYYKDTSDYRGESAISEGITLEKNNGRSYYVTIYTGSYNAKDHSYYSYFGLPYCPYKDGYAEVTMGDKLICIPTKDVFNTIIGSDYKIGKYNIKRENLIFEKNWE